MPTNPLLTTELPFTLPDFGNATTADYREAVELGMHEQLDALAAVRDDQSPATVENVLGASDDAGATLRRAMNAFWAVYSSNTTDELEAETQTDIDGDGFIAEIPGSLTYGRWGGVVILGNAPIANYSNATTNIASRVIRTTPLEATPAPTQEGEAAPPAERPTRTAHRGAS